MQSSPFQSSFSRFRKRGFRTRGRNFIIDPLELTSVGKYEVPFFFFLNCNAEIFSTKMSFLTFAARACLKRNFAVPPARRRYDRLRFGRSEFSFLFFIEISTKKHFLASTRMLTLRMKFNCLTYFRKK